ncbi:MAG: ABC transporter permease, partial [Actinomycetota bacterium]
WAPLKNTIPMVALGTLFSIFFGILIGVISAWRRATWADRTGLWSGLAFYSMPPQWLGLLIVLFVAGALGLPTAGIKDPTLGILSDPTTWEVFVDRMRHMILPALTLGLVLYGEYALVVRSAMLETLGEDYVLTARAKGLPQRTIVRRHALRNAMLPTTTLIALSLGYIVAGAILIETVYSWPGIGNAVYQAVTQRDDPLRPGAFLVLTMSVVICNFLADLLYVKLDPRITE